MVRKFCDLCGGEMVFTGDTILTSPPFHVHKCKECGQTELCKSVYPYLLHEEENGTEIKRRVCRD